MEEGFIHFLNSARFIELANKPGSEGGRYRGYKTRFLRGELKLKVITTILEQNGYDVKNAYFVTAPPPKPK